MHQLVRYLAGIVLDQHTNLLVTEAVAGWPDRQAQWMLAQHIRKESPICGTRSTWDALPGRC
jgi:hypothetical protein